jgi:hypothetical protein
MSIDRYAKFISEQARIAKLDEAKQLNEEWKGWYVKEVHNDGNPYKGERGGGQEEGNRVYGTLGHKDGHEHEFEVTAQGRHSGNLRVNDGKSLERTEVNDLEKTAHETAMRVWKRRQDPDHSSRR